MSELLLGIDVGTSGVKTGIFDPRGKLLGLGRTPYRPESPRPGWAESDPELWWHGMVRSLAEACEAAGVGAGEVGAIGVSVMYPVVVALDADARPLHPGILYSDQRSMAQVRAIRRLIPPETYHDRIGNVCVPGTCAVTSMAWLRDERPDVYADAKVLGFANTFVTARLTGEFCTDPTMASLSGLTDIRDPWTWSDDLCRTLGIDREKLPRITGSAEVIGTVTAEAAAFTGLRAGTPVVCGAGDTPVGAVGAGARTRETVAYIAGSTDCVSVPLPAPTRDRRWINCAYIPRGIWFGIGTTTSSGVSIEWFIRECLGMTTEAGIHTMTALAAAAPPGSHGLLFLPYLQGERTPIWDPQARGMFIGISNATTRAHLARAVFEGAAFSLRHVIESLEDVVGGPVREIRAVGGGMKNALWNQIKADILQKPFDILEFQDTGTLGTALLAGMGAGVYASFDEAIDVARAVSSTQTVEPDPSRAELYEGLFRLYATVYPRTKAVMHALGEMT